MDDEHNNSLDDDVLAEALEDDGLDTDAEPEASDFDELGEDEEGSWGDEDEDEPPEVPFTDED